MRGIAIRSQIRCFKDNTIISRKRKDEVNVNSLDLVACSAHKLVAIIKIIRYLI